jgi:hypothetical protein
MPQGHRDPSRPCTRASARAPLNACTPSSPIGMEERGPVTKNSRQVSGCGHDGRLRQRSADAQRYLDQLCEEGEEGHEKHTRLTWR